MSEMVEINSVQPRDPELAKTFKSHRFKYFNLPFVACFVALVVYGLIVQFSATSADSDFNFTTQVVGVVIGMGAGAQITGKTVEEVYRQLLAAIDIYFDGQEEAGPEEK